METANKVGEVKRTPFGALKKVCEEYTLATILSGKLDKFHGLLREAVEKAKQKKSNTIEEKDPNKALFPEGTIDFLHEIQAERGEVSEVTR